VVTFLLKTLFRVTLWLVFIPIKRTALVIFSPAYRDKVAYYSATFTTLDVSSTSPTSKPRLSGAVNVITHGGGFYGVKDRIVADQEGSGGGQIQRYEGQNLIVGGGEGSFNYGFMFKRGKRLRIYPLIGIGGDGSGAVIERDGESVAASGSGGMHYMAGIGIEIKVGGRLGVVLGIRAGYLRHVIGTPMRRPFVRFTFGGGIFGK